MVKTKLYKIVLLALALLPLNLVGCNRITDVSGDEWEQLWDTVTAANMEVESFKVTCYFNKELSGIDYVSRELRFVSPDRSSLTTYRQDGDIQMESRLIGSNVYIKVFDIWELREQDMAETFIVEHQELISIFLPDPAPDGAPSPVWEKLPNEIKNGVSCEHYRYSNNIYQMMYDSYVAELQVATDPERIAYLENWIAEWDQAIADGEELPNRTSTVEYWIGVKDRLLRQMRFTNSNELTEDTAFIDTIYPAGTIDTEITTYTFSDFNEPFEIEAPVLE